LIDEFGLNVNINKLIEIYRFHNPDIVLSTESLELLNFSKDFKTALISDGHYIMQKNKFDALGLDEFIEYPIFTDFYQTKKPALKPYQIVMEKFNDEKKFVYISDNPKKDFKAVKELGWTGIRFKNPVGIYRDFEKAAENNLKNKKFFEYYSEILKIAKQKIDGKKGK
jgi:putative hydrolase of the HAD superfamily